MEPEQPSAALQAHEPGRPWGRLPSREAREQLKELGVLLSLILVRMQMLNDVEAMNSSNSEKTQAIKDALKNAALSSMDLSLYASALMIALLALCVVLRRRIPRRWLDVVAGAFIGFNLILQFMKINLLLLTPPAAPAMDAARPDPDLLGFLRDCMGLHHLAFLLGGQGQARHCD